MGQTLNKIVYVHLKSPILEIWCCHKHTNQLFPSGLKFDTNLKVEESVPKQSGSIALHKSFLQAKYSMQCCLFVLANIKYKHFKLRLLATFGTCYSSKMPSSSLRLKGGKILRNMSPSRFVNTALRKSLLQSKYIEYCMKLLSVCSGQSNACIQNPDFWYWFTLAIVLLLKCIL